MAKASLTEKSEGIPPAGRLTLAILLAVYTCNFVDRYIISMLLEPLRVEFKLSDAQLGLMGSLAYGVAYAVASIPFGMIIDRANRKRLLAITLAVWSGFTALSAAATGFLSMAAIRACVGASESAATPASFSIIADAVPPHRRSTATGIFFAAAPIGLVISFAGGGWIAQEYGWRTAFLVVGLPGLLLSLVVALFLPEPERGRYDTKQPDADEKPASIRATFAYLFSQPLLLSLIGAIMIHSMAAASMTVWTASYFIREHGLGLRDAGLLIAIIGGIGIMTGGVGTGALADRLALRDLRWPLRLSGSGAVLTTALGCAMAYAEVLIPAILLLFLTKIMSATYMGPAFATSLSKAPTRMRGTLMSIQMVCINLVGFGLGPLLTGFLSDVFGGGSSLRPAIAATLSLNLVAAAFFFYAARQVGREAAAEKRAET